MALLNIRELTLQFDQQPLFERLNFSVNKGEWVVFLGSSGEGKSSLLRAIAGLENSTIKQGSISLENDCKFAWLAQQDSLFPWLSVLDNVQLMQQTLKLSHTAMLCKVRLPAALPALASGLRIAVSIAPIGAIVGEWVGSSEGLGYLMLQANARMQIDLVFAALFLLLLIAHRPLPLFPHR